jgi:hypothetical protein
MSDLVPGVLLHHFGIAVLALPVSLVVLAWYRRAVLKMRERGPRLTRHAWRRWPLRTPRSDNAAPKRAASAPGGGLHAAAIGRAAARNLYLAFQPCLRALRACMMGYAAWPPCPRRRC